MSAEAQVRLQHLWEKLSFHQIKRTIAREPEDILMIWLRRPDHHSSITNYKRIEDVPKEDRPFMSVSWRHFYGFTTDDVYFHNNDYDGIDIDIDLTMTWSRWENHKGGYQRPEEGSWVYGEVIDTPRGKRLTKWHRCTDAFKLLVEAVRGEVTLSEDELAHKLLVDDYPDKFWGIARLVLFDNVQAFVDNMKDNDRQVAENVANHPAAGVIHGSHLLPVWERGMFLSIGTAEFVHRLSYTLGEPKWWTQFLDLAAAQNVSHSHPAMGGVCDACDAELNTAGHYRDYDGYYGAPMPYLNSSY